MSPVPVWSWGLTPESLVLLVGKASPREVTWVLRHWTPPGNNWHRSGVQGMVPWAWRLRREEAVGGAEGWEWGWGWRWAWQFPDPKVSPVNSGFKSKELCPWAICCGDLAVGREKMTVLLTFDAFSSPRKELGLELSTNQDRGLDPWILENIFIGSASQASTWFNLIIISSYYEKILPTSESACCCTYLSTLDIFT